MLTPTILILRVKSLSLTNASSLFFLRGVHIIHPSICTHPSTHPCIIRLSRKQNLFGHLNNTLWYFYIHSMSFHDSGLFLVWILSSSLDLSTFHYTSHVVLVNTYSCSKTFRLLLPRPPSTLSSLYPLVSHIVPVPHFIWNFTACVVIIYVLAYSLIRLGAHLSHFHLCIRALYKLICFSCKYVPISLKESLANNLDAIHLINRLY